MSTPHSKRRNRNLETKSLEYHDPQGQYLIPSQQPSSATIESDSGPSNVQHQPKGQLEDGETGDTFLGLADTVDQLIAAIDLPRSTAPSATSNPNPTLCTTHEREQKGRRRRGKVTKLGELVTNPIIKRARASKTTISGHRQAGFPSSRINPNANLPPLVLAVSRRTNFSVYLKKALAYLRAQKVGELRLMATGCAISMCLSLAMAIEANLQPQEPCKLIKTIKTGTVVVADEITPDNNGTEDNDLIYQTRNQASIDILLSIHFPPELEKFTSKLFPSLSTNHN
ncbi:hypothetical protein O181_033694 [Austropuccinia psidii MF-1]|uniref:Uncharacterized protein n=1 Tax=Austropuccinia psidii MF-1 TaxID=1389203 RepID=A0A9Q3CZ96_9BASI|nr:hypothetical protein [Austropuccinia psidii MF-1]